MVDSDSAQFSVSDEVLHLIVTFFADYFLLLSDYSHVCLLFTSVTITKNIYIDRSL